MWQASTRKRWARYDTKVEALLGMGAAGVVETLLRTVARNSSLRDNAGIRAQVHHSSDFPTLQHASAHPCGGF